MAEAEAEAEAEALRLKSLAEKKYPASLKSALKYAKKAERLYPDLDNIFQMVTTFQVLHDYRSSSSFPNWYQILQLQPFSHPTTISKQYKKLALLLHPANNPCVGADDAFETVGLAFLTLSDKIRRQQFDMNLRIRLRNAAAAAAGDTFWTACSTCRLYHEFDRKYLRQRLMCPSCKKTFLALEVPSSNADDDARVRVRSRASSEKKMKRQSSNNGNHAGVRSRATARVRATATVSSEKAMKRQSSNERLRASSRKGIIKGRNVNNDNDDDDDGVRSTVYLEKKMKGRSSNEMSAVSSRKGRRKDGNLDDEWVHDGEVDVDDHDDVLLLNWLPSEKKGRQKRKIVDLEISDSKKGERGGEKTLAEMQLEMKRKLESKKVKKEKKEKEKKEKEIVRASADLNSMFVEDADFYDFDKDRIERSFKKGQVWAVYDDDDGMPRHYGLVDDVVSVNPFLLKMSWLDLHNNSWDETTLLGWEKLGFHISCGRFKVGRKVDIDSVNCFSHLVECERAAKEIYRIYPKKGSVWALYAEEAVDGEWGSSTRRDRRCYDIVVFLTSYSEMHGLSMAYLDKVEGFKTIFKRREIGCHAIRWFEKDDVRSCSHQIPARKISGEESSDLPKDCWELDPASLPSDLLRIDCAR